MGMLLLLLVVSQLCASARQHTNQTNLLFIMFDDLRPQLSAYGLDYMMDPNFDRLAAKSVIFDLAYSQVAVCCPSRNSLLTGLRPDTLLSYNFQIPYSGHLTIPQRLSRSGYNTAGTLRLY